MEDNVKVLFDNKWIQVLEKQTERNGSYVYTHSKWCNGQGVAILPYRFKNNEYEFLGRFELTPAHGEAIKLCSITGGYDNADRFTIEECALNELSEEAGYIGKLEDLISLGTLRPSKSSDSVSHIFAIDVDKCKPCVAMSDGTLGEVGAYCDWISANQLSLAQDPLLHSMLVRMLALDVI